MRLEDTGFFGVYRINRLIKRIRKLREKERLLNRIMERLDETEREEVNDIYLGYLDDKTICDAFGISYSGSGTKEDHSSLRIYAYLTYREELGKQERQKQPAAYSKPQISK